MLLLTSRSEHEKGTPSPFQEVRQFLPLWAGEDKSPSRRQDVSLPFVELYSAGVCWCLLVSG